MDNGWGWRPEFGRWRRDKYGYPARPTNIAISTKGVPLSSAYDYWREIAFSDFQAGTLSRDDQSRFQARATGITCEHGDFFTSESGGLAGARSAHTIAHDGLDGLSVGLVIRGHRWAEQGNDGQLATAPGELFVYDAAKPSTVTWSEHAASYLVIRRADLQPVLGGEVPDSTTLAQRLAASPMRHLVADQFRLMANHLPVLGAEEQAFLLHQTVQLACFALAQNDHRGATLAPDSALFHTAIRYISSNLADSRLDAARVAAALNCSRATLYLAFSTEEIGVTEGIRDMRLDRALYLLEHARSSLAIAEIAMMCGIYDTANFSRQFRRRFGRTPSEVREGASQSRP